MADVFLLRIAAPVRIRLVGAERSADRVQSAHKLAIFAENLKHMAAHA